MPMYILAQKQPQAKHPPNKPHRALNIQDLVLGELLVLLYVTTSAAKFCSMCNTQIRFYYRVVNTCCSAVYFGGRIRSEGKAW